MELRKSFFAQGALAGCIFYFMAMLSLFPGPNEAVPVVPRNAALAVCAFGILSALAWLAHVRRTAATTVRMYFSRMGVAIGIVTISLLMWYIDAVVLQSYIGHSQNHRILALNCLLAAVIVHQFVRGFVTMRARWKTSTDVFESLRTARLVTVHSAGIYDYAFYVTTAIAIGIVSRYFSAQNLVLYIGGAILALVFPHICGAQLSRSLILRRLFPNDAQLPAELQI